MSAEPTRRLTCLVVDDDEDDRNLIKERLGSGCFEFHELATPEGLRSQLLMNPQVCLADVRFNGQDRLVEIVSYVSEQWPQTIIIVLSALRSEMIELGCYQDRILGPYSKRAFFQDPDVLRQPLLESLRGAWSLAEGDIKVLARQWQDLDTEVKRLLPPPETEILVLKGYVAEVRPPHVEVVVEEPSANGGIRRQLEMPYELFRAQGILGHNMRFSYRMSREGSKIVSELLPDDSGLGPRSLAPDIQRDFDEMEAIEVQLRADLGRNKK